MYKVYVVKSSTMISYSETISGYY